MIGYMTDRVGWLIDAFKAGWRVLYSVPIILVPVGIVFLFNQYSAQAYNIALDFNELVQSKGAMFALSTIFSRINLSVVLTYIFLTGTAVFISIYSVHNAFLGFSSGSGNLLQTLRRIDGRDLIMFFIAHVVVTLLFFGIGAGASVLLIDSIHAPPYLRLPAVAAVFILVFPVYYMTLSFIAVIACSGGSIVERVRRLRYGLRRGNIWKLSLYYVSRIGSELALVGGGAWLIAKFGAPSWALPLMVMAALIVPLAAIRTTGFALKLEILKDDPWFRKHFESYYVSPPRSNQSF